MKDVIKKAAKFESAKSLDGYMSFLKGNVGKIYNMKNQEKTPMTRPMPNTYMGITKLSAAGKAMKVAKAVKTVKAIKRMSK
jgi:hypothetical protein